MILSNLLFRVRQYARDNRAKLIRALVIAAGALLLVALIVYAIDYVADVRSEKKIRVAEGLERNASARANKLEAEANALKLEKESLESELRNLETRAADAETALRNARGKVITLKEEYETIRYRDVPTDPVSVVDVCSKLGAIGYRCD